MEEFKRLLRAFTVYNGEKVEQDLKITKNVKKKKADLIFVYVDYIAERSAMLLNDERLMEDDLVKELDNSLKALSVFYLNPAPIDFGQFFNLLWDAFLDMESLFTELDSPSSLKDLAPAPLGVFFEAVKQLNLIGNGDKHVQAYCRRVAVAALSGGVPVDYLADQPGFKYNRAHFPTHGLALKESKPRSSTKTAEQDYKLMVEHEGKDHFSEASLRVLLWDSLVSGFFRVQNAPWQICSELNIKPMLGLDCERTTDLAIVTTRFDNPTLVVEIGKEHISNGFEHKDFSKMNATLSISCIRLAQKLRDEGINPSLAKTFGILIGGDKVQLAVCHPVFVPKQHGEEGIREIYTSISMHGHWFLNLTKSVGGGSFECEQVCCLNCDAVTEENGEFPSSDDRADLGFLEDLNLEEEFDFDIDELMKNLVSSNAELDKKAFSKLAAFLKRVKLYITTISKMEKGPEDGGPDLDFDVPNIAYIPEPATGTDGFTPFGKRVKQVDQKDLAGVRTSLFTTSRPRSSSELELYKRHFVDYFIFPKMFDYYVFGFGAICYTFEQMLPLMGNGIFGPFGGGKCFCPGVVRASHPDALILDAATFAAHSLYGLHALHEKIGFVHGKILPENIMFSPRDGIWKLNDFGFSLPVDKSLKTPRESKTSIYIAPESQKTGIYTKASDVFALGKVILNTFSVQIMWLFEMCDVGSETRMAYDDLVEILKRMTASDPQKRSSVLESLKYMNMLIQENLLEKFEIHGQDSIMVSIKYLLEESNEIDYASASFQEEIPTELILENNPIL